MKKLIIAFAAVILTSAASLAQSGGQPIEVKAKQLAHQAGCLDDYHGPLDYSVNVISSCFAGGFVTEVTILPVCTGQGCEFVKLGPLAKVTFYCDEEIANASVICF